MTPFSWQPLGRLSRTLRPTQGPQSEARARRGGACTIRTEASTTNSSHSRPKSQASCNNASSRWCMMIFTPAGRSSSTRGSISMPSSTTAAPPVKTHRRSSRRAAKYAPRSCSASRSMGRGLIGQARPGRPPASTTRGSVGEGRATAAEDQSTSPAAAGTSDGNAALEVGLAGHRLATTAVMRGALYFASMRVRRTHRSFEQLGQGP